MAALDFPANPINGDVYSNWIFDSSIGTSGAWKAKPYSAQAAVPSAVPPTAPSSGDLWYNTNDGTVYVYYTDQDGSQWVEVKANSGLGATLGARVDALEARNQNFIINGDFEINQRAVTSIANITSAGHWTADRWFGQSFGTIGVTQSRSTTVPTNDRYTTSTKFACTSAASGTGYAINYTTRLEGYDVVKLGLARGAAATLSFWVRSSRTGTYGVTVNSGYRGAAYNFSYYIATYSISQANTWEYKTITITGNTSAYTTWYTDNGNGLELTFNITGGSGIATATATNSWVESNTAGYFYGATTTQSAWGTSTADEFYITGVQLERGTSASPFRRYGLTIPGELAACQRYYQKSYILDHAPGTNTDLGAMQFAGTANGGGNTVTPITLRVQMRAAPSVSFWAANGAANVWDYERSGASGQLTANPSGVGTSGFRGYVGTGVSWAAVSTYGHWAANAEM